MDKESKKLVDRANAKIVVFEPETMILKEGEVNLDMYKILTGHVEVYVSHGTPMETLVGVLGPKSCFGEFGLLLQEPAIYTIIAFDRVTAIRITEGQLGDFVQDNHSYVIEIMRGMAKTMMKMRSQINLLASEIEEGVTPEKDNLTDAKRIARRAGLFLAREERFERQPRFFDTKA